MSEAFLQDACEAWERHGQAALEKMATREPAKFVQVMASLLPKEVKVDACDQMTEEQLIARIREIDRELVAQGFDLRTFEVKGATEGAAADEDAEIGPDTRH